MNIASDRQTIASGSETDWKALHYFNLYRIILAGFFAVLVSIKNLPDPLGEYDQTLFSYLVYGYLFYSLVAAFITRKRVMSYQVQVASYVIVDIVLLSFMMYASGGLKSGFGTLIVITVACGSILSARQLAVMFAAVAAILMLGHETYIQLFRLYPEPNYTQAAFHGIAFFITSIAGHLISSRLKSSEALAEQRALDIQSLANLNEQIVQRMQSGIIAVDDQSRVRLINEAAKQLLGYEKKTFNKPLQQISPFLATSFDEWQLDKNNYTREIHAAGSNTDIKIGIAAVGKAGKKTYLIFLDDLTRMRQQAQGLKLASLGRLTASIAHEIRNPLGAISHAGQLLGESSSISSDDDRLTEIIREQSIRINQIIENVLSMSRREPPLTQELVLIEWFDGFIEEVVEVMQIPENRIKLDIAADDISVMTDASQLHQVIWNLTQNASRYSKGDFVVAYECGIQEVTDLVYIDVIDSGSGMADEKEQHLFEPFYTTEKEGSGLGLYIARELCEMNRASLNLIENTDKGCRFRIQFPHQS